MDLDKRLQAGLSALSDVTLEQAKAIDVSAAVLGQAHGPNQAPKSRRWIWWSVLPVCAAAGLWLWLRPVSDAELSLRAQNGAALIDAAGKRTLVRGAAIGLALPSRVATSAAQEATLSRGEVRFDIATDSDFEVSASGARLRRGLVEIDSKVEQQVDLVGLEVRGSGRFQVERLSHDELETEMRLTKKHAVIAGAVAAVAVYAGWTTFGKPGNVVRVEAPGGAYMDKDGTVRRFGLNADAPDRAKAGSGEQSSNGTASDKAPDLVSGAYWNEDKKLVLFRIPGEVVDAETGSPISDFEVEARVVDKGDYGQKRTRSIPFTGRSDGTFTIDDLGMASWRVTVRAKGYSPLVQTLDLSGVDNDPFLFAPLSSGARLSGRVLDYRGNAVEGAEVALAECFEKVGKPKSCTKTKSKSDGSFSLPGVPEDQVFAIRAEHPRYGVADSPNIKQSAEASEHVTIELRGIVRIFGEVSKTRERLPVPGARVASGGKSTATDGNGFFEMFVPLDAQPEAFVESVPERPKMRTKIATYPDNRSAHQLNWVSADTHVAEVRMDFRLEMENGRLFGRVIDASGKPMAGLEMNLRNSTGWSDRGHETFPTLAVTDSAGRYSVEHVPVAAGYTMLYRTDKNSEWQRLGYVNVKDGEAVEANFTLGKGAIRGSFVNESGAKVHLSGMACQRVGARLKDSRAYYTPRCLGDGRFEFVNLSPGTYVLENKVEWMASSAEFTRLEIAIKAGELKTDVQMKVKGEGTINWRFRVLDQESRFVSGGYVRLLAGKNTSMTMPLGVGSDGIAHQSIPRKYSEIFVEAPGYQSLPVDLSKHDPDKVIELRLSRAK